MHCSAQNLSRHNDLLQHIVNILMKDHHHSNNEWEAIYIYILFNTFLLITYFDKSNK